MSERLAAAEMAANEGRIPEVVEHLQAAVAEKPDQPLGVYRALVINLYRLGRYEDGDRYSSAAVERYPREHELWNMRGVILRRLRRFPEALQALDQAAKLAPREDAPLVNRGNVLLDMDDPAGAEAVFSKLVRRDPRNPEHHRQLGRCLLRQERVDAALVRFRQATTLRKDNISAWLDLVGALADQGRDDEADKTLDKATTLNPNDPRLAEAKVILLRRLGKLRAAEALLRELEPRFGQSGWLHYQLGLVLAEWDRDAGGAHLRRAVELEPQNAEYLISLAETVERTRTGDEGANIDEAYGIAKRAVALGAGGSVADKVLTDVFSRVCDFEALDRLGDLRKVGRGWAQSNRHTALLKLLPRVRSLDDRIELLDQHREWGRRAEARAAQAPIRRPPPRPADGKIRLGLMSSDLRSHPVGYFAMPLFEHLDRERFELYAYSFFQGREDPAQARMRSLADAFRWHPDISDREAAQMIADDQLDMLIELGGSTHMNKLGVMAYRPAPLSASWVAYPFSAGLSTIDYLVVDPYLTPERPDLMMEKPLTLPQTWYPMSPHAFRAEPAAAAEAPVERNGFVTFGTANNVGKYTPELFAAWAEIMRRTPDSRFLFIRPEGGSATFRANALRLFDRHGVSSERVLFAPVRGRHLPHYNEMDISLDTFPQTGGTTTCESLWMGVPVVTLVGPALFERLSYTVLMNLDLEDLCAPTPEAYVEIAASLAADRERISTLRRTLRERIAASPLRDIEGFAKGYFDAVEAAVRGS